MAKVLVTYYSRTGNTKRMAEIFAETLREEGLDVTLKPVEKIRVSELLNYDGIAVGSPTYYGQMAAEVKKLFDESVKIHGKLDGKVGAAFTSSGGYGCGGETTVLSILNAMLIHGMIVQGDPGDFHYGAIVEGRPEKDDEEAVRVKARRMATLLRRLHG